MEGYPVDPRLVDAYFAFMESSRLLEALIDAQVQADGGISYAQFVLLTRLLAADRGRLRMSDLAHDAVHSPSGLTYQARALEQAGLVTRTTSQTDRRSVEVAITERGRDLIQRIIPNHVHVVWDALALPLSAPQRRAFVEVMLQIRDHLRTPPNDSP